MMEVPGAVGDTAVDTRVIAVTSTTGTVNALRAPPGDGAARRGGVIVIHEAFGLNDHIRDVARRFAATGYDAIAPDLYSRTGAPAPDDMADLFARMLGAADNHATVMPFEGAGHAFFANYRDTYVDEAAHELWSDVTAFFASQLGGV